MAHKPFDSLYPGTTCDGVMFQPREYQLEMLEASRKGNIIVAVTHVPLLSITGLCADVLLPRWTQEVARRRCE